MLFHEFCFSVHCTGKTVYNQLHSLCIEFTILILKKWISNYVSPIVVALCTLIIYLIMIRLFHLTFTDITTFICSYHIFYTESVIALPLFASKFLGF